MLDEQILRRQTHKKKNSTSASVEIFVLTGMLILFNRIFLKVTGFSTLS